MASTDWTALTNSLSDSEILGGVTSGVTPPVGGGSYVYAFHSIATGIDGVKAIHYTGATANFNPIPADRGGRMSGALTRLASSGADDFSPFLYFSLSSPDATASAYMLGLQDASPSKIVLRKGALSDGLPGGLVGENGVLRVSSAAVAVDTWYHLRLSAIVQGTGDVLLQVEKSESGDVTAPVWEAIPGMDTFIDDALGINSGTLPYKAGYPGFGMHAANTGRRAAFDQLTLERQV